MVFTENLVRNNNTKNFSRNWEAGGNKIAFTRGMIIERSRFLENRGIGIWFDIANEQNIVRNCLIADNEDAGIFYEIGYTLTAQDNVIIGNGLQSGPGAWGASAGIALSSSPGCVIERNLLIGNKEGIAFREQRRTTPKINDAKGTREHPVWNHDEIIRRNVIAYNRDAGTWGWFDINDERHWPAAMQEKKPENTKAAMDFARDYQAKDDKGQPVGLSLEKLNIKFEQNLYAMNENQGLFNWGTAWKRNKKYASLDDVRRELNMEQGSIIAPFIFRDYLTRDFRVPANSPVLKMGAYPRGEVPDVKLGILK
jgi:parallel beta-helix repeat protein